MNPQITSIWQFKEVHNEADNLWIVTDVRDGLVSYRRHGVEDEEPTRRPVEEFLLMFRPVSGSLMGGAGGLVGIALLFLGIFLL
jgi:hypothetical protein